MPLSRQSGLYQPQFNGDFFEIVDKKSELTKRNTDKQYTHGPQ